MELLTIKEIAQQLDLPPSTVQYYRDNFAEYIPAVKHGRYLKYEAEALEVIRDISEYYKHNETKQGIKERLSLKYALNIEQTKQGELAATTTTVQQQQYNSELVVYEKQINSLLEIIRERDQAVKRRDEIMLHLLKQLRETEAALEYERLPWWRKIF